MHKLISRFSPFVIAAILALVATRNAQAVDIRWTNPGTDFWDVAANWDTASVPTDADHAIVDNGGTAASINAGDAANVISINAASTVEVAGGNLRVAHVNAGGDGFIDFGSLRVGHSGSNGTLAISDGSLNVSAASGGGGGRTTVGWGAGSSGLIDHTGGTANFNDLWVGSNGGSGTLNTTGVNFNVGTFATGQGGGTGVTNQTGGAIAATGEVHVGADAGSTGTYNLGVGASLTSTGNFFVARDGATGVFNNEGTLNTSAEATVGWRGNTAGTFNNKATGIVNANGGFLAMGRDGGTGTMINEGIVNSANQVVVGRWGGANGTLENRLGATFNQTNGELNIGRDGSTGTVTNFGTITSTGGGEAFIGQDNLSSGTFTNGGIVQIQKYTSVGRDRGVGSVVNNNSFTVGDGNVTGGGGYELRIGAWGGTGDYTNSLASTTTVANELRVGLGRNTNGQGVGTFTNDGDVRARHISIGRDGGKGTFDQNSGTVVTTNEVWIGAGRGDGPTHGADGTLNMNGGSLTSNNDMMVGFGGGPLANARGTVNHNDGTVTSTGWLNIGRDSITAKGTYNLQGSNAVLNSQSRAVVGWGAQGEVNHTAGTANFNEIWVGSGSMGGVGVLNTPGNNGLFGTTFNVNVLATGQGGGFGTTNQASGGSITVGNEFHVGADPGSTGIYNLGDVNGPATLTVTNASFIGRDGAVLGQLNLFPGSVFQANGENFVGHSMSGYGEVNNNGGTYNVTGNGYFNLGRDLADGTFNNRNGGTVTIGQEMRVGTWGSTGTFNNFAGNGVDTVDAGNITVGGEIRIGMFDNHRGRGNGIVNLLGTGSLLGNSNMGVGRDGGIGHVVQDNNTGEVRATELFIGIGTGDGQRSGGDGLYELKSGTVNVTAGGEAGRGRLAIGTDSHGFTNLAQGRLNMTGGALNMVAGGRTSIGWNGKGTFNQSAGVTSLNDVWIGSHDDGIETGVGAYNMSGTGAMTANLMMLGRGGTGGGVGSFTMAGDATGQINDRMSVGVEPGAFGTYDMSGGFLNVNNSITVAEQSDPFRGVSTGTYIQSGGTTRFGQNFAGTENALVVGQNGGIGTVNMSGGDLTQAAASTVGGWIRIGTGSGGAGPGVGDFNLSGGNVNLIGRVHLGSGGGSVGTVNQTGGLFEQLGAVNGNEREITLGDGDSTGHYNISGGTLHTTGSLFVGHWTRSTGTMDISQPTATPTLVNIDGSFTVARFNDDGGTPTTGAVVQSGGVVNAGEFAIASGRQTDGSTQGNNNIHGSYSISGGALNVGASAAVYIGRHGEGHFTQTGGAVNIGNSIRIGSDNVGFGTYSISAGTLDAAGAIEVGENSTVLSTFTQTGGSVEGHALALATGNGSKGDYSMSAGTLTTVGPADADSGLAVAFADNSTGNFVQTGGAVTSNILAIGVGTGSVGTYTQSSGSVKVLGVVTAPAPANAGVVIGIQGMGSYALSGTGLLDLDGHDLLINPFGLANPASAFTMTGGELRGVNEINTSLTNTNGIVAPGGTGNDAGPATDTGTMFVRGTYEDTAGAKLAIDLNGTTAGVPAGPGNVPPVVPGTYDILQVQDFAVLNGTLAVTRNPSFLPATGNFFQVVQTGGGTFGTFSAITGTDLSAIGGPDYQLNKITDGTNVGLLAALPGDATLNKIADFTDLGVVLNAFNDTNAGGVAAWGEGDFNDDRITDFSDLGILLNNFNQSVTLSAGITPLSAGAGAVPEPSSWALLALGGLALGARRLRTARGRRS